jgi:hypothetical protein
MNKKILFLAVVILVALSACVSKHPKCAAYDQSPSVEAGH